MARKHIYTYTSVQYSPASVGLTRDRPRLRVIQSQVANEELIMDKLPLSKVNGSGLLLCHLKRAPNAPFKETMYFYNNLASFPGLPRFGYCKQLNNWS